MSDSLTFVGLLRLADSGSDIAENRWDLLRAADGPGEVAADGD